MIPTYITNWLLYVLYQGLGLFARRDIDKDQIVIEYIGEMIKNELADVREQAYNRQVNCCYFV